MRLPITNLKDGEKGKDIWIIASGPTMDYIKPSFFSNKIVIGVNETCLRFPCKYVVCKEVSKVVQSFIDCIKKEKIKLVVSDLAEGRKEKNNPAFDFDYWFFEHLINQSLIIDTSVVGTDKLVVSTSTITSAIHLAYYLGATNIIVCGHDCGLLDDKTHYDNYPTNSNTNQEWHKWWLKNIEKQTLKLRNAIPVPIYSLNPFINIGLEGHIYS